ncbi:hypothetical protein ACQ4M3_20035 [Leptolyngbya sp. AN03gr2]|uniref:hypothetical protein n=1 Tax=unclassified Leptolyngbya TaxID=2650499 RepID=UPI003D3228E9
MKDLPSACNVYGFLFLNTSLERVAEVLRIHLGLTNSQVYVYRSQFNSSETLHIKTETFEFEARKAQQGEPWLFNGSVAGDREEILIVLESLSKPLRWAGYETKFEVYDEQFNFIAEYS